MNVPYAGCTSPCPLVCVVKLPRSTKSIPTTPSCITCEKPFPDGAQVGYSCRRAEGVVPVLFGKVHTTSTGMEGVDAYRSIRSASISSLLSNATSQSYSEHDFDNDGKVPAAELDDDASVRLAVAALEDLRAGNAGPTPLPSKGRSSFSGRAAGPPYLASDSGARSDSTLSATSDIWSPYPPASVSTGASSPIGQASLPPGSEPGDLDEFAAEGDPNFMSRVSQLPIVSGALNAYERSKASSRVVKYGAGLVESSLSTISRPLANNRQLGQLDDFARRQLERFSSTSTPGSLLSTSPGKERRPSLVGDEAQLAFDEDVTQTRSDKGKEVDYEPPNSAQTVTVIPRSRWQTVLVEAGGLGAAVSEESLKSLRYCLQWLLYASAHLDHQIVILRDFIASLDRQRSAPGSRSNALVTASASAHLSQIKHDVVETIRRVVEVVSKYAGVALPEQAKRYVRQSILGLPVKWASAIEGRPRRGSSVSGGPSTSSTPTVERMDEKNDYFSTGMTTAARDAGSSDSETSKSPTTSSLRPTEDAAERVLTFAVESLDMLRSVTQIFGDSVEKAEAWIERLRIVGVDRQREKNKAAALRQDSANEVGDSLTENDAPIAGTKRRRPSVQMSSVDVVSSSAIADDSEDGVARRKRGARDLQLDI